MRRIRLWATAAIAVLACGTAEASPSSPRARTLVTSGNVWGLAADGAGIGIHVRVRGCDSASFWPPGGKVSRLPGRGCGFDAPETYFESLDPRRYATGLGQPRLRQLHVLLQPEHRDAAGAEAGSQAYCEGPPDCGSPGPYQDDNTLYSFVGKRFVKIVSLPAFTSLADVDRGRILLHQDETLQIVDTHAAPLVSVHLVKPPTTVFLSGPDLVAAVDGSLLDYDSGTGALRVARSMAPGGRFRALAAGRAL